MKINQKIIDWTHFGTPHAAHESEKRHIVFSNVIFLTLPIVYVIFIFIDLDAFLEPTNFFKFDRLVVPITIFLCIGFLLLNKAGYTSMSRILFLLSWILLFHILPIIIHQSPSDYYFAFPAGIIFHSVLIHVSFDTKHEPWKFWLFLLGNFLLMLFCKQLLIANDIAPESENILRSDPYYVLDIILYWLLFNLLTFYLLYVVVYSINGLNHANILIANQREELAEKNEELEQTIASLQKINQQVEDLNKTLELKVSKRTQELEVKNEKLIQYAHMNAHKLRGPFCRVKGLVMLKNIISKPSSGDEDSINVMLLQSIDELEDITNQIQLAIENNESI